MWRERTYCVPFLMEQRKDKFVRVTVNTKLSALVQFWIIDFHPARTPLLSFNLNQATFLHKNEEEEIDYSSLELLISSTAVSWEIKCRRFSNIKCSN